MSVHKDLIQHAKNQNQLYMKFTQLDQQREVYIQEAVELCKAEKDFSTDKMNDVTNQINSIANDRFIPTRKLVTPDMVRVYVESLK